MKRIFLFALLVAQIMANGQTIIDSLNNQLAHSGCGIAHFTIKYNSGTYWSKEAVVVFKDSLSSSTVRVHSFFMDTAKAKIDSSFTLTSSQVTNLINFYQAAGTNTNPDPSVSVNHTGTASLIISIGCGSKTVVTYSSPTHISLYRTILSNWNNWYQ